MAASKGVGKGASHESLYGGSEEAIRVRCFECRRQERVGARKGMGNMEGTSPQGSTLADRGGDARGPSSCGQPLEHYSPPDLGATGAQEGSNCS